MSLTRNQKEETVKEVAGSVTGAVSLVLVSFSGLTVGDFNTLRSELAAAGGGIRVVPKRLLKIVLRSAELDFDPAAHEGQIAIAWGDDAVAPAKVLSNFAKGHADNIRLVAGALEGNLLTLEQVQNLAALPTREQLLGQLLSVLAGPARGLVTVLSGAQRNLVQVLAAIQEKKA